MQLSAKINESKEGIAPKHNVSLQPDDVSLQPVLRPASEKRQIKRKLDADFDYGPALTSAAARGTLASAIGLHCRSEPNGSDTKVRRWLAANNRVQREARSGLSEENENEGNSFIF